MPPRRRSLTSCSPSSGSREDRKSCPLFARKPNQCDENRRQIGRREGDTEREARRNFYRLSLNLSPAVDAVLGELPRRSRAEMWNWFSPRVGPRGWRGGRKTRLQLGAKGYGRGDGGLLGLPEPRGQACGPHAWWGAFGLGLRVGQEFSYARKIFCVKALLISKYYRTSSSDKPIFC